MNKFIAASVFCAVCFVPAGIIGYQNKIDTSNLPSVEKLSEKIQGKGIVSDKDSIGGVIELPEQVIVGELGKAPRRASRGNAGKSRCEVRDLVQGTGKVRICSAS